MNTLRASRLLTVALLLDAVATAATGMLMLLFATQLQALLHLPRWLMIGAGVFMLVYAVLIERLSRRSALPRWAVLGVIVGNALWAADCAVLAFAGILAPSTLGIAFLLVQAAIVFGFAELQYLGMKRSTQMA